MQSKSFLSVVQARVNADSTVLSIEIFSFTNFPVLGRFRDLISKGKPPFEAFVTDVRRAPRYT